MNIVLVASSYLPHVGGVERVVSMLAQNLAQRGHAITVIAPRHPRALAANESIDDIAVTRWYFILPRVAELRRGRFDLFAAGIFFAPLTLLRLMILLARFHPDVVNLHFVGAPAPFLLAAHLLRRFRFVTSLHGDDVQGLARGTWFDRWVFRQTVRRADAVTACSRELLQEALRIEPRAARNARVIVNGIALPAEKPAVHGEFLLAVGRLVPKKGFDVLLDAFAHLRDLGNPTRLVLIGAGPEQNALQMRAKELGIADGVEFRGAQSQHGVYDAMRHARVVIIPSRQEPFGLVALEAMALGKPVIASRVGGLVELLDGADAEFVPPDDAPALARAIENALAQIECDSSYGAHNRQNAARFSTARMADAYLATYTEVCAAN